LPSLPGLQSSALSGSIALGMVSCLLAVALCLLCAQACRTHQRHREPRRRAGRPLSADELHSLASGAEEMAGPFACRGRRVHESKLSSADGRRSGQKARGWPRSGQESHGRSLGRV
jgi:hypothetical protein